LIVSVSVLDWHRLRQRREKGWRKGKGTTELVYERERRGRETLLELSHQAQLPMAASSGLLMAETLAPSWSEKRSERGRGKGNGNWTGRGNGILSMVDPLIASEKWVRLHTA
jgi:hypothetical protein